MTGNRDKYKMIREDNAMNENKNIELTKEQLGEVAGGGGRKGGRH